MKIHVIPVFASLLLAAAAQAGPTEPDSSLDPERVVQIQLDALQHNDEPRPDAGIERTWAFAHPNNKRMTGPLERFTEMIKGPAYRALLDHRTHIIEPLARTPDTAVFMVMVIPRNGAIVAYRWRLERVREGSFEGAWMTVAVSPPLQSGQPI